MTDTAAGGAAPEKRAPISRLRVTTAGADWLVVIFEHVSERGVVHMELARVWTACLTPGEVLESFLQMIERIAASCTATGMHIKVEAIDFDLPPDHPVTTLH